MAFLEQASTLIKDQALVDAARDVKLYADYVAGKHGQIASDLLLTAVWCCLNPSVVGKRAALYRGQKASQNAKRSKAKTENARKKDKANIKENANTERKGSAEKERSQDPKAKDDGKMQDGIGGQQYFDMDCLEVDNEANVDQLSDESVRKPNTSDSINDTIVNEMDEQNKLEKRQLASNVDSSPLKGDSFEVYAIEDKTVATAEVIDLDSDTEAVISKPRPVSDTDENSDNADLSETVGNESATDPETGGDMSKNSFSDFEQSHGNTGSSVYQTTSDLETYASPACIPGLVPVSQTYTSRSRRKLQHTVKYEEAEIDNALYEMQEAERDDYEEDEPMAKGQQIITVKEECNYSGVGDESADQSNLYQPAYQDPCSSQQTFCQEELFKAANEAAEKVMKETQKRKRGQYATYDDATRAKIARFAIDKGVAKATRWFKNEYGRNVSESTVRCMRDQYIKLTKRVGCESATLPCSPRGAPCKLGELDGEVQNWVRDVRLKGGLVNTRIVMAGAEGIVAKHSKDKQITITKHYARSLLRRMGFVKKKEAVTFSQNPPPDFEAIKSEFTLNVKRVMQENDIPDSLVINWNQIVSQLVPGGDWTIEETGCSSVSKFSQVAIVLAIAKSGALLPPQLIYAGKTNRCLPKDIVFPHGWDITYSESHLPTEDSMLQYLDRVILPYVTHIRHSLSQGRRSQQAVVIFDAQKTRPTPTILQTLRDNNISTVYVPACCTDSLQPIDLSICSDYKDHLKEHFHLWYTQEVVLLLAQNSEDSNVAATVDLKSASLKPLHANWIISTHIQMERRPEVIADSFIKAGIM